MTVYIIIRTVPYQGSTIEKVFSTYEAAENYINNIKYHKSQYDIEEQVIHD
jgi:hypothetical protein